MNHITYQESLLSDYKKLTRKEMSDRLTKLLRMHKSFILAINDDISHTQAKLRHVPENTQLEIIDQKVQKTIAKKVEAEFAYLANGSFETSVKHIEECTKLSLYDKARAMLYIVKRYPGMHPVKEIPMEYVCEFLALIDMHHSIIYNDDYTQYGYIV
jgi:hypothetical protein